MGRSSASPIRQQPPGRASAFADMSSPLKRRRSSTFSDSIDDAKQSIRTSTDDLLLPRLRSEGLPSHLEPSHWHSTPLALALLPAIGGIFFQNGSAIVTDITLLGLAAIFLNWSVRLPWYVTKNDPLYSWSSLIPSQGMVSFCSIYPSRRGTTNQARMLRGHHHRRRRGRGRGRHNEGSGSGHRRTARASSFPPTGSKTISCYD